MQTKTSTFTLFEEKKHSVRYNCPVDDAIASSIYVSKVILGPKPYPQTLKLTLEVPNV